LVENDYWMAKKKKKAIHGALKFGRCSKMPENYELWRNFIAKSIATNIDTTLLRMNGGFIS
jgi:hypothetical protein